MASAASSFLLTSSLTSNSTTNSPSKTYLSFPSTTFRSTNTSRLVVHAAAEEAAAPTPAAAAAATSTPAAVPKPPPVGPKRGTKDLKSHYPVVVRFTKVNYANVSTNNYALDEIQEVK